MGMTRLETLPEDIRTRLGFDATRAQVAYASEDKKKLEGKAQVVVQPTPAPDSAYNSTALSSYPSSGGSVYVRGYFRKNGTYVQAYTRRR
jgi:hypothetical protein